MKQRVVLDRRHRQFEDVADEIRKDRAAPAPLWIEMRAVRNGHVIGDFQRIVPGDIAVEGTRAEALCLILFHVLIDFARSAEKLVPVAVQEAVVVEVLHVDFKPPAANAFQVVLGDGVSLFRHHLKRSFHAELIVNVHQGGSERPPRFGLDVMSEDRATRVSFRPKPDKRDGIDALCLHGEHEALFEQALYSQIDRPSGEGAVLPAAESQPLEMFADADGEEGPDEVVRFMKQLVISNTHKKLTVGHIAFMAKVSDYFVQAEWEDRNGRVGAGVRPSIMQAIACCLRHRTGRAAAKADDFVTKREVAG